MPVFESRCYSNDHKRLDKRFSNANLEILMSIDALDASKSCYLDFNRLLPLVSRYESCFEFNLDFLRNELQRDVLLLNQATPLT